LKQVNPHIILQASQLLHSSAVTLHKPAAGSTCGVSSFGMSGTNAHVVVQVSLCAAPQSGVRHLTMCFKHEFYSWGESTVEYPSEAAGLLGTLSMQENERQWQQQWPKELISFLQDHRVGTVPLVPGTGFLTLASCAAQQLDGTLFARLRNALFESFLFLDSSCCNLQVRVKVDF
jgi:acyl transferase domain-containing protein